MLGILWSYIKPGVQFLVFYIAMGMFLGLERGMHNYAVYLFSGMIAINFFSEGFGNGARAMVVNSALIRKIYLPRELFSLSTVWVALVHFVPQIAVMLLACFLVGWSPDLAGIWVDSGGHAHRDDAVLRSGSDFRCGERVLPRFGEHCGHAADGGYLVLAGAVLLDHGA